MKTKMIFALLSLALILSACTPAATQSPPAAEAVVDAPMPVPPVDGAPVPTEMIVSDLATYIDEVSGFTFDYPTSWMLDVVKLGDRAPHSIQLTSWTHEPGQISEVAEGGTIMNIVVQLWDPKNDLAAFILQRKDGWVNSGISIVSQEELTLADGRVAQEFILQSADEQSYTMLTVLGDQYLVFSGSGDLETIRQIARSLR